MSARDPRDTDRLVEAWRRPGPAPTEHLLLEAEYARRRGHRPGDPPPLAPGAPVPGCICEACTGIPYRPRPKRRQLPRSRRDLRPALDIDAARAVPIVEVAPALGLGEPVARGTEAAILCPAHDDHAPSARVHPGKNAWYCDVCGVGGSVIDLVMAARGVEFLEAIRYLLGSPSPPPRLPRDQRRGPGPARTLAQPTARY